jgi:hypothetical protein
MGFRGVLEKQAPPVGTQSPAPWEKAKIFGIFVARIALMRSEDV